MVWLREFIASLKQPLQQTPILDLVKKFAFSFIFHTKYDLGCSPPEMVFGISVTLPGQYCEKKQPLETKVFLEDFKQRMSDIA